MNGEGFALALPGFNALRQACSGPGGGRRHLRSFPPLSRRSGRFPALPYPPLR